MSTTSKPFERLPSHIVPKHYKLSLVPDLEHFVFTGEEEVTLDVQQDTNQILLNQLDLNITHASYKSNDGRYQVACSINLDNERELATITLDSPVTTGSGVLTLKFNGVLNDKLIGFYRAKSSGSVGGQPQRYAAVTKFEPTHARRAFPSWDEPSLKATFEIMLTVPKDRTALSNMPVVSDEPNPGNPELRDVKFQVSPIMSTYLVACVVGDYDYVEGQSADGVNVRVYTPVGRRDQGNFALEVAVKSLPYYKEYFGLAYPLPKLDLIAISDFASGAMENWGLVTYRETCLLVDPENTASVRKQWIALTVAHELAHMWFGNLVTMEWWTHLWLNEGFASFIEYLCVDELFPHYHIWTQFVSVDFSRALELDALHNSHPIEVPVNHPSEIREIFDAISYCKGASVIRMLHSYIGTSAFKSGLHLYLTRHQYKNTVTEDLWDALEEVSGKPVREVMSTWTKQKGYPVISVTQNQAEGSSRHVTLRQDKFSSDGKLSDSDKECLWMTPVSIISASSPTKSISETVLSTKKEMVILDNVGPNHWIKLNQDSVGVYRVQYSKDMLEQLLPAIESKALPPLDRLNIQSDLYALVKSGRVASVEFLALLNSFKEEDEYTVWSSIDSCLGRFNSLLSYTDSQELFQMYGRSLLSNIYQKIGWEAQDDEKHTDGILRPLIILRLSGFNDPQVLGEAKQLFDAHVAKTSIIPADIRSAVYSCVARTADEKLFNTLVQMYREADLSEEKNRILNSLGKVKDNQLMKRVLEFSISSEVRSQDTVFGISSVAASKNGREKAWNFLKENHKLFQERYDSGTHMNSILIKNITENFATEDKLAEVQQFFADHPFPGTERTVQQSLEQIRVNINWLKRDESDIKQFLTSSLRD